MSYWKWVRQSIKTAAKTVFSWQGIKTAVMDPSTETMVGYLGTYCFFLFGLVLGVYENRIYHWLLLGIIPSALAISHARYRRQKKVKQ